MNEPSLWPKNLDDAPLPVGAPREVLDRAATEIDDLTKGAVVGEVLTGEAGDKLELSFYLRATQVDYRYLLFKVRHTIDGFPIEFSDASGTEIKRFKDREAFEEALRQFFAAQKTLKVVSQLRDLTQDVG